MCDNNDTVLLFVEGCVPNAWTDDKLLALAPEKLEQLRRNAVGRDDLLALRIDAIQQSRRQRPTTSNNSPVIGFHFKCEADYEVTMMPDGTFWSGVWVVKEVLCDPAIALKGYVALHSAKRELSYRQGTIVDWKIENRTKGTTARGISFLLSPFEQRMPWFGQGTGERGYRRLDDEPRWAPA